MEGKKRWLPAVALVGELADPNKRPSARAVCFLVVAGLVEYNVSLREGVQLAMMEGFISGLELSRLYYEDAIRPILDRRYPALPYSTALIGPGSEVLGFDTEMSADHGWGPRALLFLSEADHASLADDIRTTLGNELPLTFRGYSTHFERFPDDPDTYMLAPAAVRPIQHQVLIATLPAYLLSYTGVDLSDEIGLADWLAVPEQKLRTLVAGGVFHDGLDLLGPMRRRLAYYPRDMWLYLLSAQWQRIGQEEPFVGRTGIVGDEIGSAVIAARLVRDLMRLCLLMEREYCPYPKWIGTAFSRLACASRMSPALEAVLRAAGWQERGRRLAAACEIAAGLHNSLGITEPVPVRATLFWSRPFLVIHGDAIARAIWDAIQDPEVKALPFGVGKVDQFVDSTDVLDSTVRCSGLIKLYEEK